MLFAVCVCRPSDDFRCQQVMLTLADAYLLDLMQFRLELLRGLQ